MANIYRNSVLTIAATAARNSSEGCFWRAPRGTVAIPLRRTPGLVVREYRWPDSTFGPHVFLDDYPLLQRAWVYQERRLSRRMVHFTRTQLVWECQRHTEGEDGAIIDGEEDQEETALLHTADSSPRILAWQETVSDYSGLKLTFETDRLPAIAALVAEEMLMRPNDTYMAGMWKQTLLHDILWTRYMPIQKISEAGRRPESITPSWSWASVEAQVRFLEDGPLEGVELVDVHFTPKGSIQLGGYDDANIVLKAPFIEAVFGESNLTMRDLVPGRLGNSPTALPEGISAFGYSADFDFLADHQSRDGPRQFFFLLLGFMKSGSDSFGMVLHKTSGSEYQRVGDCFYSCNAPKGRPDERKERLRSYIDSLPIKEVRIV